MPEPSVSSIAIYQLRVVLCGVSPLVWRRLLVLSTTSIAELHEILQNAFSWSGEHLHVDSLVPDVAEIACSVSAENLEQLVGAASARKTDYCGVGRAFLVDRWLVFINPLLLDARPFCR